MVGAALAGSFDKITLIMKNTELPTPRRQNGLFRCARMNEMIATIPMQAGECLRLVEADLPDDDASVGGFSTIDNR